MTDSGSDRLDDEALAKRRAPCMVAYLHPFRFVDGPSSQAWNVSVDDINRGEWDYTELHSIVRGIDVGIPAPYHMVVARDGAVGLPALPDLRGDQAAVEFFNIPAYLLPGPKAVFARLVTDAGLLWTHSQVTLTEILLGFGITILTAIPLGLLIALSPLSKQLVYPPIMLMQLVPKIAVAPLFLVWLGFGIESKVLLTVLLTFFPLLIASISGFQILDDRFLYLTTSLGATGCVTFAIWWFLAALP
jgi:hypothetical protein